MGEVSDRLAVSGLALPAPPAALGAYAPAVRSGVLVYTAGQLPLRAGALVSSGPVPSKVPVPVAVECARQAALNALSAASTVCDLDGVVAVLKLTGYVLSDRGFSEQPRVLDGASEVLKCAFGDAGVHARAAVGVVALPMSAPVELDLVLALR